MDEEKVIKRVSIGECVFCTWRPTTEDEPNFVRVEGAVYVFCPRCNYEMIENVYYLVDEEKY